MQRPLNGLSLVVKASASEVCSPHPSPLSNFGSQAKRALDLAAHDPAQSLGNSLAQELMKYGHGWCIGACVRL